MPWTAQHGRHSSSRWLGGADLTNAVGLNTSMVMCASFVGPAIAGLAIRALGEGWRLTVDGSVLAFHQRLSSRVIIAMRDLPAPATGAARESMLVRLLEGFRFVANHQGVRDLLLLLTLTALAGFSFGTLMPVFASTVLTHGDARELGLLMGAPGLGAMLAGAIPSCVGSRHLSANRSRLRDIPGSCSSSSRCRERYAGSRVIVLLPAGAATMVQITATGTR